MKKTKIQNAFDFLSKEEYQKAFSLFAQELETNSSNLEAQMGILLCDIAQFDPQKASDLLEFYYMLLSEETPQIAQKRIIHIIDSIDRKESKDLESLSQSLLQNAESFSCISYEDFKKFVFTKPNFKEAFEDFSLSTKIIFSHKEEVYEFLNFLIDRGYADLSMQYAENISETMGFDLNLNKILQRALKNLK